MEFYYLEDIVLFEREFVEAEKAAYRETAKEDDTICLKMHQGRRSLHQRGIEESGPYQSPTEDGLQHFHEFLRRNLDPHLNPSQPPLIRGGATFALPLTRGSWRGFEPDDQFRLHSQVISNLHRNKL